MATTTSTDYVSSGRFRAELEALFGPLQRRPDEDIDDEPDEDRDAQLALLPDELAREVRALYELHANHDVPALCGLAPGDYSTIPAQYDLDADGVREEEWFHDDQDIEVVMRSVGVYKESGSPYFLVGPFGVVDFAEDPHGYTIIADGLEPFLRMLVALEAAAQGKATLEAAEELLRAELRSSPRSKSRRPARAQAPHDDAVRYPAFVKRALARASGQ